MTHRNKEQRVKEIAYLLWEKEGSPHGESERHWVEAEALYEIERAGRDERKAVEGEPPGDSAATPATAKPARSTAKAPAQAKAAKPKASEPKSNGAARNGAARKTEASAAPAATVRASAKGKAAPKAAD